MALISAALMLVLREPMRVALALITCMIMLGGIYGLLGVHFIAAFQVLIYVGAVMVFMVYVIMLLELREHVARPRFSVWSMIGGTVGVALMGVFATTVWNHGQADSTNTTANVFRLSQFSAAFLTEYWLAFELTSVFLVAAIVAALAVIKVSRRAHG